MHLAPRLLLLSVLAALAMTFTSTAQRADAAAILTLSATTVQAGQPITVGWYESAPTGNDWISLHLVGAPNSSYLAWQYANGSTGSDTFTAPQAAGAYEFRYFRNGALDGKSNQFWVFVATLTATPSTVVVGQGITVSWDKLVPSGNDWISLHPAGAPDSNYLGWKSIAGASGSTSFAAPSTAGTYDFRLFRNGQRVAVSNTVQVSVPNSIGQDLQLAADLLKTVISGFNTACKFITCTGWSGSSASSVLSYFGRATTIVGLALAVPYSIQVGNDLTALDQAVQKYGQSSAEARGAAYTLCTDTQRLQRALTKQVAWDGLHVIA